MDSGFYAVHPGWQVLDPVFLVRETWISDSNSRLRASYIEQAPAVKKVDNAIHGINLYRVDSGIGPLQLVIPAWYKIAVLESKSRPGTRQTKKITI